ncbi:hypothetical protein [Cyanobium sp. ATX 6F1]|uniref:hypothetical protein n=1 Tax=Cyanobium sp. ATX 6F1 TaxID=2823702 RepID=UPI0020CF3CD5|nr:hypothetical protein [Cyanobium sp. ATX 6F1]MCP9917643.1 hypothetical protein [Cyanobium sp. ATX 6F1]
MASLPGAASTVLVGLSYAFAGVVAARAAIRDTLLEAALDGLAARRPDRLVRERALRLYGGAPIVGAGGLMLAIGSLLAMPVFLLTCLWQAAHFLVLCPTATTARIPSIPLAAARASTPSGSMAWPRRSCSGRVGAVPCAPPATAPPWSLGLVGAAGMLASSWGLVQLWRVDRAFRSGGDP